ncbi:MAG TPA: GNAT family N-acetyltransferase [Thermoplasmata archaeon]|nr:GNAT family N-acetyltransferase [Thermoplasmata archaeon]
MPVRDLAWTDYPGWMDLYYSRFDEIHHNPDLGVFLRATKPTPAEEAALFGQVMKSVLERDMVAAVSESDGRIVGVCTIARNGHHFEDRHVGTLGIALLPEHRGRGVGTALLGYALERCRGVFEIVELKVLAINDVARKLYRRHGFVEFGLQPRSFKRGDRYLDEVLMQRTIDLPP